VKDEDGSEAKEVGEEAPENRSCHYRKGYELKG
jgi:hypothetical protein